MTYVTGTMNSASPAKDLMAALNTTLVAGGLTFVETVATPTNANWSGVAYGNGVYVTVAAATATAATSSDGVTWVQRSLPAVAAWQAVAFGNGVFVAIASNSPIVATSADGVTWALRGAMPSASPWIALIYANNTFVAVANSTSIAATSPDGVTWTARTLPASVAWSALSYGSGVFVASAANVTNAATSPDGVTWTARTLSSSLPWSSTASSGTLFVTVATTGTAGYMTSADGISWVNRTLPAALSWSSITYGGGLFVAVASGSAIILTSPDGIVWTQRTVLATGVAWNAVTYGGGQFVVTATNNTVAATSPDALTWTPRTLSATSSSSVADVYKSPAAANQFGQDWYLFLRRAGDYQNAIYYQVAETYNASTHRASNLGGQGQAVVPVTGTYQNPAVAVSPDAASGMYASAALIQVTPQAPMSYWVSANANRVIIGLRTATENGVYLGLYDDLLPTGTTQFPLVAVKLPTAQSSTFQLGSSNTTLTGGFTREPLQTLAATLNFEAVVHSGYLSGGTILPTNYTVMTSTAPLYNNPGSPARVMLGTARSTPNTADALRGLLIGCVCSATPSIAGDVITAGGRTYVRVAGATTTFGYFVDQGL